MALNVGSKTRARRVLQQVRREEVQLDIVANLSLSLNRRLNVPRQVPLPGALNESGNIYVAEFVRPAPLRASRRESPLAPEPASRSPLAPSVPDAESDHR